MVVNGCVSYFQQVRAGQECQAESNTGTSAGPDCAERGM